MSKKIVFSGAPGTGKTSVLNLLQSEFIVQEEVSREIIKDHHPETNLLDFSKKVWEKRFSQFFTPSRGIQLFDRSLVDVVAYLHFQQIDVPDEWHESLKEHRYHSEVFIFPPWKEIYLTDNERWEDFDTAQAIHNTLMETYQSYGYTISEIPKISIFERAQFIKKHISSFHGKTS